MKSYPLFRNPPGYRYVRFHKDKVGSKVHSWWEDSSERVGSPWGNNWTMLANNEHYGLDAIEISTIYDSPVGNELMDTCELVETCHGFIPSFGSYRYSLKELSRMFRFGDVQTAGGAIWKTYNTSRRPYSETSGNFEVGSNPFCCLSNRGLPGFDRDFCRLPGTVDYFGTETTRTNGTDNMKEKDLEDSGFGWEKTRQQQYIPLDIGRSFISEIVPYYKSIFGKLPLEYACENYSPYDGYSEQSERKLRMGKSMEEIESKFKVLNKFQYRLSGEEIDKRCLGKETIGEVNYVLEGGILLNINLPYHTYVAFYQTKEQFNRIQECMKFYPRKRKKKVPTFQLLSYNGSGFNTTNLELKDFRLDLGLNYNDDLPDKEIRSFLKEEKSSGLCMLYGCPGTGKTYYIRHLIKSMEGIPFIYMNKECLLHITDSSFVDFLIKHKNSVFIMEDCENVLRDRTEYNNTISTLLNLSDGIIGDAFNNKFICTFNTDISLIDKALLRKGRMKLGYEFRKLPPKKANALSEKMGSERRFDKDVALCEVLNSGENGEKDFSESHRAKVGF